MEQPELGRKIVQLRKSQNLTQEELASKSSLGLRTIQRIETGGVRPRNSTIDLLLAALGEDRDSVENIQLNGTARYKILSFFLIGDQKTTSLYSVLKSAWIAGVFYFLILIFENGMEYLFFTEENTESTFRTFYILIKVWILLSFILFIRGFIVLSKVFENQLLGSAAYIMMGLMVGVVFSDILKIFFSENEGFTIAIIITQSLLSGVVGIIFGIALIKSQDSLGVISKYSGITEIIVGVCFVLVFLSPLALALLVPVVALEIVILYKGAEFMRKEML